jgi:hypothetical protein
LTLSNKNGFYPPKPFLFIYDSLPAELLSILFGFKTAEQATTYFFCLICCHGAIAAMPVVVPMTASESAKKNPAED